MSSKSRNKLAELHRDLETRFVTMDEILGRDDSALLRLAPDVSAWSVANQLHHTATATGLMLTGVHRIAAQSTPAQDGGRITTIGRAMLLTRHLPRGRGKAPRATVPPENVDRAELERALTHSRSAYDRLPGLFDDLAVSTWRVEHPYFGWLSANQWLKLAALHADHHFSIIQEIDAAHAGA